MAIDFDDVVQGVKSVGEFGLEVIPGSDRLRKTLQNAAKNVCNAYSTRPENFFTEAGELTGPGLLLEAVCQPYFDDNGYQPPSAETPFSGGQCPVLYTVITSATATVRNLNTNQTFDVQYEPTNNGNLLGPLGPVSEEVVNVPINSQTLVVGMQTANGGVTLGQFATQNDRRIESFDVTYTVTRQDGQPDTCGNPPAVGVPGTAPVYNFGDTYIDGDTNIPVTINLPDINLDGTLNIPINVGGIQINFPGWDASESDPSGAPSPVEAAPAIPGGELADNDGDFPSPPDGKEYVGAVFRMLEPPPGQPPVPNTTTQPVYPTVYGNFRLKLQSDNEVGFLSRNYRIREKESSIFRDDPGLQVIGAYASLKVELQYEVIPLLINKPEA